MLLLSFSLISFTRKNIPAGNSNHLVLKVNLNSSVRILLGLQWRIYWRDNAREEWHFTSQDIEFNVPRVDRVLFWWSQYIAVIYWFCMTLGSILKFQFLAVNENYYVKSLMHDIGYRDSLSVLGHSNQSL